MSTVDLNVKDVPAAVRKAVEEDARERDVSVNDVQGEILARRYGLAWEPSGYPYSGTSGSDQWVIRIPRALRDAIKGHAEGAKLTQRGCVLLALSDHYGMEPVSPRKRSRYQLDPQVVREARRLHDEEGISFRELSRKFGIRRDTLTKAIRAAA